MEIFAHGCGYPMGLMKWKSAPYPLVRPLGKMFHWLYPSRVLFF
jgi:hypothetical protein